MRKSLFNRLVRDMYFKFKSFDNSVSSLSEQSAYLMMEKSRVFHYDKLQNGALYMGCGNKTEMQSFYEPTKAFQTSP